ncbi:hypothetical protein NO263_03455 [Gluconacetobacter entanii]|uniref:Uncharacterized protein n=2 Tax=Acetobacteraceae TaxID=433 RepID=A0ABQ0SFN6_NOVHA|nr:MULTISPECIES: hypothetical protein [Acetobacteraceae]MCW4589632.1 hypothetical protein [Gluconacetobacter entanii]MCW4592916.1 hypothetical protein [Gluconacetobacter entanii]NPC89162.1 hypothetical protein [Gluconacetobacter entanii]GAN83807.1 hypothetical protein Gaha_0105_042 [Novacetimonas hansenii JCM 7643]GBQ63155.1 hypothetical protein AA0243_3035 [Novacetimonas hansenii NRIC 0243]
MLPNVAVCNALLSSTGGLGQNISWEPSAPCPCIGGTLNAPQPNCPQCHGIGHIWFAAQAAWSAMTSMKLVRQWAQYGEWMSGDIVMSIPSDSPFFAAGEYDRVTLSQSSEPFGRTITVGENDRLAFTPLSIDRVFWLSADGSEIITGGIPVVNADGTLTWPADLPVPAAGQTFTMTGRRSPLYFLFRDFPQDREHASGLQLPRRVVLRKFDLLGATQGGVTR